MPEYAYDVLVEPRWLAQHLDDDAIRIIEVDEDPALYRRSHIPGAIGLDGRRDLEDELRRDILGPEEFGRMLGSRGVSNEHLVILYGDRNNWFAAYAYWYLKYYGHSRVKLLNGPRERWIAEGLPMTQELPGHSQTTFTAGSGDRAIRAMRDEVLDALDGAHVILDVRAPQEYSGELSAAPRYVRESALRAGRIPGAVSVPWAQAVNEDGTFKSPDELRELYAAKGVLSGDPIIAYCRIGERAALTWFVLHELLGAEHVKTYDGSWSEWGNLIGVPIERD